MKRTGKKILAGTLLILGGALAESSYAADLAWQTAQSAAAATYQEPIGGRIEPADADAPVRQQGAWRAKSAPASAVAPSGQQAQPVQQASYGAPAPVRQSSTARNTSYQPQYRTAAVPRSAQYQAPYATAPRSRSRYVTQNSAPRVAPEPEPVAPGAPMGPSILTDMPPSGPVESYDEFAPGEGYDGYEGYDGQGGCECDGYCDPCGVCRKCPPGCIPAPRLPDNWEIFGGVQGFKGPLDQGRNGNFGFNEGFNIGGGLWLTEHLGYQLGARWAQSNFNGDQSTGFYRDEYRPQTFVTAGLFARATQCWPWQGGAVIDWLYDDYTTKYNVSQVRVEVSRFGCFGNEIGFLGAINTSEDEVTFPSSSEPLALTGLQTLRTTDQYLFFVRRHFDNCGEGRIWGGATNEGDGLVGGDFRIPLSNSFALAGGFNYLIANEREQLGQQQDSWGLGMALVFQPFCKARSNMTSPYRPLFNVADNSTLFVEPK